MKQPRREAVEAEAPVDEKGALQRVFAEKEGDEGRDDDVADAGATLGEGESQRATSLEVVAQQNLAWRDQQRVSHGCGRRSN